MRGATTVWHCEEESGLEKRQCTAQLTIFAEREPRVKPLLVFRGKGLRISQAERMWKHPFSPDFRQQKLLIADVHGA